jgi:hypothetical protein
VAWLLLDVAVGTPAISRSMVGFAGPIEVSITALRVSSQGTAVTDERKRSMLLTDEYTNPPNQQMNLTPEMLQCIRDCTNCHSLCVVTAMHCLHLGGPHAAPEHIRLLLDCADICRTSADFMLRGSDLHTRTCGVCAEVCRLCADDCERFGDDPQMKACAEACRLCAQSCRRMADRQRETAVA